MSLLQELEARCNAQCELCGNTESLETYLVPPKREEILDHQVALCSKCNSQVSNPETMDANQMRCAAEAMWSQHPPVQVVSYRILKHLSSEQWASDALGMIYMEDATREWADAISDTAIIHKDSNGHVLQNGDSVVLIKDLNVKGSSLTAKRGTAVRRIRLDPDNETYIEGKVEGQQIVILTQYVKKM